MSQETLDILRDNLNDQIELSPFSEVITIDNGPDTFHGIFDNFHIENNKDNGNVSQKRSKPGLMVSSLFPSLVNRERIAKLKRENGDVYTFQFYGKDEEGVPIIWLV